MSDADSLSILTHPNNEEGAFVMEHNDEEEEMSETTDTAFSRIAGGIGNASRSAAQGQQPQNGLRRRRRRGAYGSSLVNETTTTTETTDAMNKDISFVLGSVMTSSDLLQDTLSSQQQQLQQSDSLFGHHSEETESLSNGANDDGTTFKEELDYSASSSDQDSDDDDATVAMELPREDDDQVGITSNRGRKRRAFSPAAATRFENTSNAENAAAVAAIADASRAGTSERNQEAAVLNHKEGTLELDAPVNGDSRTIEHPTVVKNDSTKISSKPEGERQQEQQPDEESLITSIDNLFVHVDDKNSVTIGDIYRALQDEYDVKLKKATKAIVKKHLTDLMKGLVEPSTVESVSYDEPASDDSDEEDDAGVEESDNGGEAYESSLESSSDEEEQLKEASKRKRSNKKKRSSSKTTAITKRTTTRRPARASTSAKKKPSHVRIHAEMLRKRRIEELRVRNEELQVKQSKEDQQRAEQIAAKFETDSDELRLKRLEDRLDLLQKLNQKRIRVVSSDEASKSEVSTEARKEESESSARLLQDPKVVPTLDSTEESDSDDDDIELEIVGKEEAKEHVLSNAPKSSATFMLDLVRNLKSTNTKVPNKRSGAVASLIATSKSSPAKGLTARAALRNRLRAKQRNGANMWLARELGYKTQEEHMRDCMLVEQKKRDDVVKREEARLLANERKQLRERMLLESMPFGEVEEEVYDPDEPAERPGEDNGDDSDEEMAMAREIEEEEQTAGLASEESPAVSESTEDESVPPVQEEEPDERAERDTGEAMEEALKERTPPTADDEPATLLETLPSDVADDVDGPSIAGEGMSAEKELGEGRAGDGAIHPSNEATDAESIYGNEEKVSETFDTAFDEHMSPCTDEKQEDELPSQEDSASAEMATEGSTPENKASRKDRNAGWKAMLQKEADKLKKDKARRKGNDLVEAEADEEEEEEVAGLEDFGFSLGKKKKDDDDEDIGNDKLTEEDMKHVVDDVSDDEGDEEAGEAARKELEQKEDKERHKDIIRRMREGYDGRRGGIAGGGAGARGMHRFDQLVAADNREDAKRLGLLNDDELDSDDEDKGDAKGDDSDDDEAALLDKMLKDRFLHRSSLDEVEENFSSDDDEEEVTEGQDKQDDDDDEKEQERLAKRFAKRARMQRLIETHGHDEEFSQLRLIDEDETTKLELKMMKSVSRKARDVSTTSSSGSGSQSGGSDSRSIAPVFGVETSTSLALGTSSLSLALQASRASKKKKTSFLGGSGASKEMSSSVHKCLSMGHVVFNTGDSQFSKGGQSGRSNLSSTSTNSMGKRKRSAMQTSTSLWSKVSANGFKKKR